MEFLLLSMLPLFGVSEEEKELVTNISRREKKCEKFVCNGIFD